MKIIGIGTDIININRISKVIKKNKLFTKRIFSNEEIKLCKKKMNIYECFAKRFAAKEAFVKALGTGFSKKLSFKEIYVKNNTEGKPTINIRGKSLKVVKNILKKKYNILLSLSDDKPFATAVVIITV